MVGRWAVVRDGQVDNVVLWDGVTPWSAGDGCEVYDLPDDSPVGPGWRRVGDGWVAPDDQPTSSPTAPVSIDPTALAAFVTAVADPNEDNLSALARFAAALTAE